MNQDQIIRKAYVIARKNYKAKLGYMPYKRFKKMVLRQEKPKKQKKLKGLELLMKRVMELKIEQKKDPLYLINYLKNINVRAKGDGKSSHN